MTDRVLNTFVNPKCYITQDENIKILYIKASNGEAAVLSLRRDVAVDEDEGAVLKLDFAKNQISDKTENTARKSETKKPKATKVNKEAIKNNEKPKTNIDTEISKPIEKYEKKISSWKQAYVDEKARNVLTNRILDKTQKLKDLKLG